MSLGFLVWRLVFNSSPQLSYPPKQRQILCGHAGLYSQLLSLSWVNLTFFRVATWKKIWDIRKRTRLLTLKKNQGCRTWYSFQGSMLKNLKCWVQIRWVADMDGLLCFHHKQTWTKKTIVCMINSVEMYSKNILLKCWHTKTQKYYDISKFQNHFELLFFIEPQIKICLWKRLSYVFLNGSKVMHHCWQSQWPKSCTWFIKMPWCLTVKKKVVEWA